MEKGFKNSVYAILAIGALFIIGTISINIVLKNKLENFIQERLPDNMIRAFEDITVETFGGSLSVTNASLIIKNKNNNIEHTFINVEKLKISDISYWDYLFNDEIHIENITLENPTIAYYKDRVEKNKDTPSNGIISIYKPIVIDRIKINNTKLAIYEKSKDSTNLYTKGLSVELDGIRIDNNTIIRKIPIEYDTYKAKSDTVFVKVGPYENLTVRDFSIANRNARFEKLTLKTKYSKKELSRLITKERDHYDLTLQSLSIDNIDFGFESNRFFAKSDMVSLVAPILEVYRDKLVADDPKIKPLYGRMLRDLPFELTVDSLKITNGKIKYEERVKSENMGGSINFVELNATISNVSNTYEKPETTNLKITADFMDNTPFTAFWSFDVNNKNDAFLFKANVGALVADKMNSFTEPNLKVKLEGRTNKTYFTIDGNNENATTDMKINYSNFDVTLLRKDGKGEDKFLSAITNIFISKNSKNKEDNFKEGTAEATRDKTKSIFNFLWISVKAALTKIMI
ncbi:hypothetical protein [Aequorivita lipolytica]|uniref:DUF748 domain-containing protein n=1 Tax=Aequorivita lipolytica TaxID=153267 RepID=A0A5C6YTF3_9FLAO|nr:hypothetical protein [Aequorivita lipolytica]TXD70728.1 hypothetical protein ESV24_01125 [Aequorivita lipolytica]SRX49768.1 hypothetical protein AEQU2_00231 [Aequorivita lipolytica]